MKTGYILLYNGGTTKFKSEYDGKMYEVPQIGVYTRKGKILLLNKSQREFSFRIQIKENQEHLFCGENE
jgi:hypothetical protein